MRKVIWKMSEDHFDMKVPQLQIKPENLDIKAKTGEVYSGELVIESINDVEFRGIVYSDNPYISFQNSQFEGKNAKIHYTINTTKFIPGTTLSGELTIVTNFAETKVPYFVEVKSSKIELCGRKINEPLDFAFLAQNYPKDAMRLFYSQDFADFMALQETKLNLLYLGYRKGLMSATNMEEFLVAAHMKERIRFDLNEEKREYFNVKENRKEVIEITKNCWGHVEIRVSTDADFISLEKEVITEEFFLGSVMSFNFYIHKDKLHAGLNYARISFDSADDHKEIIVVASFEEMARYQQERLSKELIKSSGNNISDDDLVGSVLGLANSSVEAAKKEIEQIEEEKNQLFREKEITLKLARAYERYRLGQLTTGEWATMMVELLSEKETYTILPEKLQWYELMKAQAYIANGQRQEALWIIADLKREIEDKHSVNWAYLLYLCTLIEREESYINRLTAEIETIFREHDEDVRIFWFLLFLRADYVANTRRKLKDISQWVMNGYDSPFLYIEAYQLFQQDPYLLTRFDGFEMKILNWMDKHNAFTRDIALQFFHILAEAREYDEKLFEIATHVFEKVNTAENLLVLVSYLLKGMRFDEKYLKWYQAAIEEGISLAGLFEAYMMSLPMDYAGEFPTLVTKYFRYNNSLSYERRGLIYSSVIANRLKQATQYEQYLRNMESFSMEQMRLGHIDDNLAIVYKEMMRLGFLNAEVASFMAPLVFTAKIGVIAPDASRIIVFQEAMENPYFATVRGGFAYAPLYSKNYVIFIETTSGVLIAEDDACNVEYLFELDEYIPKLRALSPREIPYIIHYFETLDDHAVAAYLPPEEVTLVEAFLDEKSVAIRYKLRMYPMLIRFLESHGREELLREHLLKENRFGELDLKTLNYLMVLLINNDDYLRVLEMARDFDCLSLPTDSLIRLCFNITRHIETEDDFVTLLCARLLDEENLPATIISYLVKSYAGPTANMLRIFKEASTLGVATNVMEERLIVQMLYTQKLEDSGMVYRSYLSHRANPMVAEAYATAMCRRFLLNDEHCDESVLAYVYQRICRDEHINESCRYGLMKGYSQATLDEDDFKICDELLREAVSRNTYFDFFKKFEPRLILKYHLYDKAFLQIKAAPRKIITIHTAEGEEEIPEMYPGIYVKQFVLFFGEEVDYTVTDQDDVIAQGKVVFADHTKTAISGRYDMLNQMQSDLLYDENENLATEMKRYQGLDFVTQHLFTVI